MQTLYTTYSKADDKALGKGVRLTQCPRCKRFADKYVEHDLVVLFIDLVLIKPQVSEEPFSDVELQWRSLLVARKTKKSDYMPAPLLSSDGKASAESLQVYRHLLFNLLSREDGRFHVRYSTHMCSIKH